MNSLVKRAGVFSEPTNINHDRFSRTIRAIENFLKRHYFNTMTRGWRERYPSTAKIGTDGYRYQANFRSKVQLGTGYRANFKSWVPRGTEYRANFRNWLPLGKGNRPNFRSWVPIGTGYRPNFKLYRPLLMTNFFRIFLSELFCKLTLLEFRYDWHQRLNN